MTSSGTNKNNGEVFLFSLFVLLYVILDPNLYGVLIFLLKKNVLFRIAVPYSLFKGAPRCVSDL